MGMLKPRFETPVLEGKTAFRNTLGSWFSSVGKDYPWRRTREPYPVLVSEVMLQQTRIATVLGKGFYTRFLEKFPDAGHLADADDESLLKAWEGLGYYRRARMLRETARAVIANHGGNFPDNEKELLALPGIGPYTAAALLAFAFGKPSALVDGNVSRVLSRLMDDAEPIDSTPAIKRHREWAGTLCDTENPARHHHAMMELGQTICTNGIPDCVSCPVATFCKTTSPHDLPVKKPRTKITATTEHAIWCRDGNGRLLLHHESGSRRTGLWKLPLRTAGQCAGLRKICQSTYHITRYKVSLNIYLGCNMEPEPGDEWIAAERLDFLPMATPFRKALERLLADF